MSLYRTDQTGPYVPCSSTLNLLFQRVFLSVTMVSFFNSLSKLLPYLSASTSLSKKCEFLILLCQRHVKMALRREDSTIQLQKSGQKENCDETVFFNLRHFLCYTIALFTKLHKRNNFIKRLRIIPTPECRHF